MKGRLTYLGLMVLVYGALLGLQRYQARTFQVPPCRDLQVVSLAPAEVQPKRAPAGTPLVNHTIAVQFASRERVHYSTAAVQHVTVKTNLGEDRVTLAVPDVILPQQGYAELDVIVRGESGMCQFPKQRIIIRSP